MAEKIIKDVKEMKIKKKAKAKTEIEEQSKALEFSTLAKFLPIREVFRGEETPYLVSSANESIRKVVQVGEGLCGI